MGSAISALMEAIDSFFKLGLTISEILLGVAVTGGVLALAGWAYTSYYTVSTIAASPTARNLAAGAVQAAANALPAAASGLVAGGLPGAAAAAVGSVALGNVL